MSLPTRTAEHRQPSPALALPFGAVALIGLATVMLPPYTGSWIVVAAAAACLAAVVLVFWLSLRRGRRTWLDPMAAYLLFPFAALLRHATAVDAGAGMVALMLLPIIWIALTGTRSELVVVSVLSVVTFLAPSIFIGAPQYPLDDWRRAVVWPALTLLIAPVMQRVVEELAHERRVAEMANMRVERLFEDAPHGVALLQPGGEVIRVNNALAGLIGVTPVSMGRRHLADFEAIGSTVVRDQLERLRNDPESAVASDGRLRAADGNDIDVAMSSRAMADAGLGDLVMVNVVDISERRRHQDRLAHLVDHDVLTGLGNRRRFDAELQRHLERGRRYGNTGAVLLLDLDHFKTVNDTLGHNAGDELLVSIGGLLRRAVRSTDVVARLGGDEFAILMPDGDQEAARQMADNVAERVRQHAATLDGVRRWVTASVGAVTFQAASEQAIDILALADMTMYDAKEAGRNQSAVLPEGENRPPRAAARLHWQSRIQEALEHDRFEIHLQPIMDLADDRIVSAEALLRLRDEEGLVPPSRFIYIAERTGLMPQVDRWVIRNSMELLVRIQRELPGFSLEVNLSGHSIGDPDIEREIVEGLARHDLDPHTIILEITETAAVADVALAREFAERLTALGCRFALDDFGAGFGSFYYLKHLLFDYVKIDGEFVAAAHRSAVDRTILRSIVGIARELGKQTVAEFVSEPEVLEVVRTEGVDAAQGYLIGPPVPVEEFVATHLVAQPHGAAGSA